MAVAFVTHPGFSLIADLATDKVRFSKEEFVEEELHLISMSENLQQRAVSWEVKICIFLTILMQYVITG